MLIEERVKQRRPRAPDAQDKERTKSLGWRDYRSVVDFVGGSPHVLTFRDTVGGFPGEKTGVVVWVAARARLASASAARSGVKGAIFSRERAPSPLARY